MASQTTDAKTILQEWQTIARDLYHQASFNLRQQEIAADAIFQAKFLVQFPDHQPTLDKLAALRNTFLAAREEDAVPLPMMPEEKNDQKQKLSVTRSIQFAEDAIKFHQSVLAKLKQIEALGQTSPEQTRALLHEVEELGQTRRKFINTHVANTGHKSSK